MKITFFGSDDFAQAHLESLIKSDHEVVGCVTQADRPKGRGMKVVASPVKELALRNNIHLLQPSDIKESNFIKQLKAFKSDLFVIIAYGKILPSEILGIPSICVLNVHASFLPKYRGAAPVNWAIINGEKETGVTIIKVNDVLDAGDIFAQEKIKILSEDTSVTLKSRMVPVGVRLLLKTIDSIAANNYSLIPQDSSVVTSAPKLTKELGEIQWGKGALEIRNLVRGLLPWPSAYTFYKGKLLKILSTEIVDKDFSECTPGEVIEINKQGFIVATGQKGLLVKKVHLEASKPMDAYRFIVGHQLEVGFCLGKVDVDA